MFVTRVVTRGMICLHYLAAVWALVLPIVLKTSIPIGAIHFAVRTSMWRTASLRTTPLRRIPPLILLQFFSDQAILDALSELRQFRYNSEPRFLVRFLVRFLAHWIIVMIPFPLSGSAFARCCRHCFAKSVIRLVLLVSYISGPCCATASPTFFKGNTNLVFFSVRLS